MTEEIINNNNCSMCEHKKTQTITICNLCLISHPDPEEQSKYLCLFKPIEESNEIKDGQFYFIALKDKEEMHPRVIDLFLRSDDNYYSKNNIVHFKLNFMQAQLIQKSLYHIIMENREEFKKYEQKYTENRANRKF